MRTRTGLFSGLVYRPEEISEQVERTGFRSVGVMRVEQARLARAGYRHLIVSDENMIGSARNNLRQGRLYPLADERLLRFRPAFADRCRRIALTIRSYDSYWSSALAYAVAQGHRVPSSADCDLLVTQPRRWRDLIRDISHILPQADIVVMPFERLAHDPVRQLAILTDGLSSTVPIRDQEEWRNPSPRLEKLRNILVLRGEAQAAACLPGTTGRWMPFDESQREALRGQYLDDLTWLRRGADGLARLAETAPMNYPVATTTGQDLQKAFKTELDVKDEAEVALRVIRPPERGGLRHEPQRVVG